MKHILLLTLVIFSLTACPPKIPEDSKTKAPKEFELTKELDKGDDLKPVEATSKKLTKKISIFKNKTKMIQTGEKYTISYPADWELKTKFNGTDSMAMSQPEDAADTFRENINVVIEPVQVQSRKAYFDANMKTMEKVMHGFKIISTNTITLASGIQATHLIYLHEINGVNAKNRAVFIYEKGKGYVITATAKSTTFEKFNPQFEEIIQSFKISQID